jgi:hypothetical protein
MPDQLEGYYSFPVFKNLYVLHLCDIAPSDFTRSLMIGLLGSTWIWFSNLDKGDTDESGSKLGSPNMRHSGLTYVGKSQSFESDEGVQI